MYDFIEKIRCLYLLIESLLNTLFGEQWILFILYFILNIIDIFTNWIKIKINKNNNLDFNIIKKISDWILIIVSFLIPIGFEALGQLIEIDLAFTSFLGWFVVATLIISECKSILRKLMEIGCNVPSFLIKGLEIASKRIENKSDSTNKD